MSTIKSAEGSCTISTTAHRVSVSIEERLATKQELETSRRLSLAAPNEKKTLFAKESDWEQLSADWNPQADAFLFWMFVRDGRITLEKAKLDILMRPRQLAWLQQQWPLKKSLLRRIYEKREETWMSFLYYCAYPEEAALFDEQRKKAAARNTTWKRLRVQRAVRC